MTNPAQPDTTGVEPLAEELPPAYRDIAEEIATAMDRAADAITRRGVYRGYYRDPHVDYNPAVDARGAINVAVFEDPEICGPMGGRADRVTLALLDHLGLTMAAGGIDHDDQQGMITILSDWSDDLTRTKEVIARVMRDCAARMRTTARACDQN